MGLFLALLITACCTLPATASAVVTTLAPNGDKAAPSNAFRETVGCGTTTANMYSVVTEDPASPVSTNCSGGAQAEYVEANLPTNGSSATMSVDFSATAGATTTVRNVRFRVRACATAAGNTLDIAIKTGVTTLASDSYTLTNSCNAGVIWYTFAQRVDISKAQADAMYVELTMARTTVGASTVRVTAMSIDAYYCAAGTTICGVAWDRAGDSSAGVWPGCTGTAGAPATADLNISINGGAAAGVACNATTGDYSVATAITTGQIAAIYMTNPARATDYGVTYIRSGGGGGEMADVIRQRTTTDHYSGASVTNANILTWDNTNAAKIPVDVTGTVLTEAAETTIWPVTGSTYAPGGSVTVTSAVTDGTLSLSGITFTLTGIGTGVNCTAGIGTRKPLCNGGGSTTFAGANLRWTGVGTTELIGVLTPGAASIEIAPASGTSTYGTGNGNLTTGSFTIGGGGGNVAYNQATSGTITASGDLTIASGSTMSGSTTKLITVRGNMTGAGTVNVTGTGGVMIEGGATRTFGPTVAGTGWTFDSLTFGTTGATPRTVSMASAGAGVITVTDLDVGRTANSVATTLDLNTNDRPFQVNGDLLVTSRGVLSASSTQTLTLRNNYTSNGTFTHNSGTVAITPATDGTSTVLYSGAGARDFSALTLTGPGRISFDNVDQTNVTGALTVSASGCTTATRIMLMSDSFGSRWELNATGSTSFNNVVVQDGAAITALSPASPSYDAGNNTGWTFSAGACKAAAPSGLLTQAATQPTNIATATPTFSAVNNDAAAVDTQRTQVYTDLSNNVSGLWRFDTSGTATIGPNNATLNNGATAATAGQTDFGQVLTLDGVNDYASIPSAAELQQAGAYTLDAYFKTSSLTGTRQVIAQRSAGTNCATDCNYSIEFDVTNTRLCGMETTGGVLVQTCGANGSATALADGAWHHVALMHRVTPSQQIELYVDGVAMGTPTATGAANTGAAALTIGSSTSGGSYFTGQIDEVRLTSTYVGSATNLGYYRGHRPHYFLMWDSSPTDAGVALASCSAAARCANITYATGGGQLPLLRDGAHYEVQTRYRLAADGIWSAWGSDYFRMSVVPLINVTAGTVAFGALTPGTDTTGTTTVQVTTTDDRGYTLTASYDTQPFQTVGGSVIPAFVPSPAPASVWASGSTDGFGFTVLGASGGAASRLAQWGTGTNTLATDFVNNEYAGLAVGTDALVHTRTASFAGQDNVDVAFRVNIPTSQNTGSYSATVSFTALANP